MTKTRHETQRPTTGQTETTSGEQTDTVEERQQCTECGGRLQTHGDQVHCVECGLVVEEDRIDHGPEWRSFSFEDRESKSRVGLPMTTMLHDRGLSTTIDWRGKDGYGGTLSNERRRKFQRLRRWDERFRTQDASDRNLKHALGEIDRMGSALGVPDSACETASVIYRRALKSDLLPGRSIEGMATASLYAALRQASLPRSADEVATVSRIDYLEATRSYRYLVRELELPVAPPNPLEYIPRYASQLDVSNSTEQQARRLLKNGIEASLHSGKHPVGLVAAAIYAAGQLTGEQLTQDSISEATSVSNVTIRNRYQELLEIELDDCESV